MTLLKIAKAITPEIISELTSGSVRAIKIPNFYAEKSATSLAESVLALESQSKTNPAIRNGKDLNYGVSLLGVRSNDVSGCPRDSDKWETYKQDRDHYKTTLKLLGNNQPTPLESIVADLNKQNTLTAQPASFHDIEASYGGFRLTYPGESLEINPHFDLPREEFGVQQSFAINVYLKVPEEGRDLLVWPAEKTYIESGIVEHVDYINSVVSTLDPITVPLNNGDAVLFNTCVPHGVRKFDSETASIAQQSFFVSPSEGLLLFYS